MAESPYKFVPCPYPPRPEPKQVVVDPTFSKEGYAADAKLTGDRLKNLEEGKLDKSALSGKSVELVKVGDEQRIEIAGFLDACFNTVPSKNESGQISWISAATHADVEKLRAKLCKLIKEVIPELQGEIEEVENRLNACKKQFSERLEKAEGKIAVLETKYAELVSKYNEIQNKIQDIARVIQQLQQLVNEKADKEYVDRKDAELHASIVTLDNRVDHLYDDLLHTVKDVEELTERVGDIQSQVVQNVADIAALKEKAVTVDPQNWTEAQQAQARKNIGVKGQAEVDELVEKVRQLEEELASFKESVENTYETKEHAAATYETISQHQSDIENINNEISKIQNDIGDMAEIEGDIVSNINALYSLTLDIDGGKEF